MVLGHREVEDLAPVAEAREGEVAGLGGGAHRRVVPGAEACRHQRLDVRGEQAIGGAGGAEPELLQVRMLRLGGVGAVLLVLVAAGIDDGVDRAERRGATLQRRQHRGDEDLHPGGMERIAGPVGRRQEAVRQVLRLGEAGLVVRQRGDAGERVEAVRAVLPVERAEAPDLVAEGGADAGGELEELALDVEDHGRAGEAEEVGDDEADPLPCPCRRHHQHVRLLLVAGDDERRLRRRAAQLADDEAVARTAEHAVALHLGAGLPARPAVVGG